MLDFLHRAVQVDTYTLVIVAILAGWAGVLTMHVLQKTLLALIAFPGFIFGALIGNYIVDLYGFRPTPDNDANVIVACTIGIMLTLLVVIGIRRLTSTLAAVRVERNRHFRPQPLRRVY